MNLLNDTIWSPVSEQNAAAISRETADELMERLEWMTVKPLVILDMGNAGKEERLRLQQRYPDAKVIAFDPANHTLQSVADQSADLIFANMVLPWQADNKKIFQEWRRILRPNGLLIFSTLGLDTLKECQAIFSVEALPRLIDMHDVGDDLLAAGFSDPVLDVTYYTTIYQNKEKLLAELQISSMLMITPAADCLDQLVPGEEGAYQLTYEVIYAHAFAPLQDRSTSTDGVVKVPLSQLKRK